MDPTYQLYVYDISYFSGKMQAYLRYKEIPHEVIEAQWSELAFRLVEEAGVMEVPLLRRPDGTLMRDSTSMITSLEREFPNAALVSADPALTFVMHLLEDYADEGLWRAALYYRWAFDTDAQLYARRFLADFLTLPVLKKRLLAGQRAFIVWRQRRVYLREEGVTAATAPAIEQQYLDELRDLSDLLGDSPYLLGDRPSLVDFGYMASMFRHFSIDPTPSKIMRDRAPRVYEWVAKMWNSRASEVGSGELMNWCEIAESPALRRILSRVGRLYLPYLKANAAAVHAGQDRFDVTLDGLKYPGLPAMPFRAWTTKELLRRYSDLKDSDRRRVDGLLENAGCLAFFSDPIAFEARYPEGDALPECLPRTVTKLQKLGLLLTGTPHHFEAGTRRSEP